MENKYLYNIDKVVDYMKTIKCVYHRIIKDNLQIINELSQFQDFFQEFNIIDDTMFNIVNNRFNILYDFYYKTIINHTSVKTNVNGLGEFIIKPNNNIYGTVNIIKYQNFIKCKSSFNLQNTVTIGSCDNFSIVKLYLDDIFIGLTLNIGNISFTVYNFNKLIIDDLIVFGRNEVITNIQQSINIMFSFIDTQIKTFGDIILCIETNVSYLDKYIHKFKDNLHCHKKNKSSSDSDHD